MVEIGRQLGDETDLVRGSIGADGRSKKGDFVATLGESSWAPGARILDRFGKASASARPAGIRENWKRRAS